MYQFSLPAHFPEKIYITVDIDGPASDKDLFMHVIQVARLLAAKAAWIDRMRPGLSAPAISSSRFSRHSACFSLLI